MTHADWNAARYDPRAKDGHVESWFLKATDPSGERAFWLKATIFAPDAAPSRAMAEGWAVCFDRRAGRARQVGVKHTLPFTHATFGAGGLGARWELRSNGDRFELAPGVARGAITMGSERVTWDLAFRGEARAMVLYPPRLYELPVPRLKIVTPLPDARFEGELEVGGERWVVSGWRGMQGHNWGRHAELYAWSQVTAWDDGADLVLEVGSGRVRVGGVLMPLGTVASVRHRGVDYSMTRLVDVARARASVVVGRHEFSAVGRFGRVEGVLEAAPEDMVGLAYANPDGTTTYCLNSKLARARVRFEATGRPPLVLTSRAAALEVGTLHAGHGVRMVA